MLLRLKTKQESYRQLCGNAYSEAYADFIYVNELGKRVKPEYITKGFPKFLVDNGLRRIRFHDLRHSCASLLYANNVSLKDIQEWLGHSDIGTTANTYTHLDFSRKEKSAAAILPVLENREKSEGYSRGMLAPLNENRWELTWPLKA